MTLPNYPNQGHQIVLGWDQESALRNWTAYLGEDGRRFLPPSDRSGYSEGVTRRLTTGGTWESGWPIVNLRFPWISDGQIYTLKTTFKDQNVTVAVHVPGSIGVDDTDVYNAVFNFDLNQLASLEREKDGYKGVVIELVLVEAL